MYWCVGQVHRPGGRDLYASRPTQSTPKPPPEPCSGRAAAAAKTSDGPADAVLRESPAGRTNPKLFKRCAELEALAASGPAATARHNLRLLARRILHLTEEIDDLNKQIADAVEASTPGLLDVRGVGPDSAAALLISAGDNSGRLADEASFAALCGTSPVEASFGKTRRRRLNRGGDRQANAAL
ncbi:transposase [Streptomyces acidicola]|uniref:transposase n=1 Tax=Streptomyces acidicola TaxID=2596892 RepID=UPI00378A15A1